MPTVNVAVAMTGTDHPADESGFEVRDPGPLFGPQARRSVSRVACRGSQSRHAPRRGMASELVRRGASTTAIQQAGGWRSPQMVARYASAVNVEDGAVARFFG